MILKHSLIKLLKTKMSKKIEYIWYCPRKRCNCIITKTTKPYLDRRIEYKCKNCNVGYRGDVLMLMNKDNIKNTFNRM